GSMANALALPGGSTEPGVRPQFASSNGSEAQHWVFTCVKRKYVGRDDYPWFQIRPSLDSDLCMSQVTTDPSGPIVMNRCKQINPSYLPREQLWTTTYIGGGAWSGLRSRRESDGM